LGKIAEENFWYQQWDKVVDFNMAEGDIKWFTDKIKHNKNCIDRHLNKEEIKQLLFLEPNNR
jgi:acetyl-CoA synthetase